MLWFFIGWYDAALSKEGTEKRVGLHVSNKVGKRVPIGYRDEKKTFMFEHSMCLTKCSRRAIFKMFNHPIGEHCIKRRILVREMEDILKIYFYIRRIVFD